MWQLKSARKSTSFVSLIVVWVCLWCLNLVWCKKVWLPQRVAIWTLDFIPGLVRRQISNFKKRPFWIYGDSFVSLSSVFPQTSLSHFFSLFTFTSTTLFSSLLLWVFLNIHICFFFFWGVWLPQNNQMVQIKNKKRRVVQTGAHSNLNLFEGKERLFSFTVPFLDGFKHSFLFFYFFIFNFVRFLWLIFCQCCIYNFTIFCFFFFEVMKNKVVITIKIIVFEWNTFLL